jgi:membrane protease YdiL (CAAX protease family)
VGALAGVALFTLYHFESPWEGPVRFAVVLPMAWAVWKLRSVRLGIVVHVALNTLSAIALALAVMGAR